MAFASHASSLVPTMKDPGLLLTHDWAHLHTPHGLIDSPKIVLKMNSDYQTLNLQIRSASQYEACANGRMVCDVRSIKGCPAEIELGYGACSSCSPRPLSAVAKVTYKVTSSTPGYKVGVLSKEVVSELRAIMAKLIRNDNIQGDISVFLHKYGSHYQLGAQTLGKAFIRMVVIEQMCDSKYLTEIAEEIFAACDNHFNATPEGSWYNPKQLLNTSSWSQEKKQMLNVIKLRMSHFGIQAKTASLEAWMNEAGDQPQTIGGLENYTIVSVWDLITMSKMQDHQKLSNAIKEGWEQLVRTTNHQTVAIPHNPQATRNILNAEKSAHPLVEELGMEKFFPCKLSRQNVRYLQKIHESYERKEELVWRVLEQLMLTNPQCREQEISNYVKAVQRDIQPKKRFGEKKSKSTAKDSQPFAFPHPMDVLFLLFTCSDFMLRQILARKLFLCRLAIPFIIPATSKEKVEMLIWPLRSIIMEWVNKEEALVKCTLNMVTFMRCGNTKVSKSKLLNELLSLSGHPAFFHQGLQCGNQKRLISNGTVELSHFLPSGNKDDHFSHPALFFNLRGDVCDHPVQHDVLMELPTTVVILVDIGELENPRVQEKFKTTLKRKTRNIVTVLTDSKEHDEDGIDRLQEVFSQMGGDKIKNVVTTFEMEGGQKNLKAVNEELKDAIARQMVTGSQQSMESLTALRLPKCVIDEKENVNCSTARERVDVLLASLKKVDPCDRKKKLLPQQDYLCEIGKQLRQLHRSSSEDSSLKGKEAIKQHIKAIRQDQSKSSNQQFAMKIISLFQQDEETKEFAIKWMQLELDAITCTALSDLQATKNRIYKDLTNARSKEKSRVIDLECQFEQAQKKLAAASCGWEHMMREVGQLHEVSSNLEMRDSLGRVFNISELPEIVGRQLLDGHPVELMDGDNGIIPIEWVKAVFRSLAKLAGKNKKIFVLSVLGIQSSGKSTLLNTMFGLEFAVSAGRCTKGIYAQLLPVTQGKDVQYDYILVLDSEGLKSQQLEHGNCEHDNEIATLIIGLADITLINLKGENTMEMTEFLQIVLQAFLRMKWSESSHTRQCMFIHQNVAAINAQKKLTDDRQKLLDELDRMTQDASFAQGLTSETISSFNQIISFDIDKDVAYFPDLWNGILPMAIVNQGYCMLAAQTRQIILEQQIPKNFNGFITITDFISRVEDMWNGVLTDDFIFSFRNTLAARAYIEMEREYAKLTFQVEEELLQFVITECKLQMENTKSEDELHQLYQTLHSKFTDMVTELISKNLATLVDFFVHHNASKSIGKYKSGKESSFSDYCQKFASQRETDLENMEHRNVFRIRQSSKTQKHEQEIMKKALCVAQELRGQNPSDEEIVEEFDKLWDDCETTLASTSSKTHIDALKELRSVLWNDKHPDMKIYFEQEKERTPLAPDESMKTITSDCIVEEHIELRKGHASVARNALRKSYLGAALTNANSILKRVMRKVEDVSKQDVMFNTHHGRQIIDYLFKEIAKHNELSPEETMYEFTPAFKAKMGIRVACCTAPMFDRMSQQFEEKHGVYAQVQAYKQRVYLRFKNTVKDTSAEMTASEDFCEALKAKVLEYAKIDVEKNVLKDLYNEVGNTKYDLIIKMLEEFIERSNMCDNEKRMNFEDLIEYVRTPLTYAARWLEDFSNKQLFCRDDGQTKYRSMAKPIVGKMFSKIMWSVSEATRKVQPVAKRQQYSEWITAFSDNMKDTLPLDAGQLRLTTNLTNFENFQSKLKEYLERLEKDVMAEFAQINEYCVEWNWVSPSEKVLKHLWGCAELCPLCLEPCQHSDPNHRSSHRCIQHRPPAIRGTHAVKSKVLSLETCNLQVTLGSRFACSACNDKCRLTEHCNATDEDEETTYHPFREYKKFLPDWDIAPDPADNATKFWQWAIWTYQEQILEQYEGIKLEIPESWYEATVNEALDSLRQFAI